MSGILLLFIPIVLVPGFLWLIIFVGQAIVGSIRDYIDL
jgi:hypothetical protein